MILKKLFLLAGLVNIYFSDQIAAKDFSKSQADTMIDHSEFLTHSIAARDSLARFYDAGKEEISLIDIEDPQNPALIFKNPYNHNNPNDRDLFEKNKGEYVARKDIEKRRLK